MFLSAWHPESFRQSTEHSESGHSLLFKMEGLMNCSLEMFCLFLDCRSSLEYYPAGYNRSVIRRLTKVCVSHDACDKNLVNAWAN